MTDSQRDLEVALAFEAMPTEPGGSWSTGKPGSSPLGHWKWVINREYITREVKSHLGMPVGELIDSGSWRPVPATEAAIVLKCWIALFDAYDTPEEMGIIGQDQWITRQHDIYYRVRRNFDEGMPIEKVTADAILAAFLKAKGKS